VNSTTCCSRSVAFLNMPPNRLAPEPALASRTSSGMLPASCSLRIASS